MEENYQNKTALGIAGKILAILAVVAACVLAVVVALYVVAPQITSHGTVSLKNAIIQSANQCYAIEGSYPYNLEYLENNYGLVVNHDDYSITYEVFADNVAPSVVVVEK